MTIFTIITINYNNRSGLKKTIDSVISQSYRNYEWIIIDGNSKDGSYELIVDYKEHFSFWTSEIDTGIYNAMNKGIKRATGEYILFLNSGDYLADSNVLMDLSKIDLNADFVYGYILRESKGKLIPQKNFTKIDFTISDFLRSSLPHQATLIKRDLFDRHGLYDEHYKIASDWKFFLQAIIFGNASVKYIDLPIAVFEDGGISEDRHQKNESLEILKSCVPDRILPDIERAVSLSEVLDNKFCAFLYKAIYRLRFLLKRLK